MQITNWMLMGAASAVLLGRVSNASTVTDDAVALRPTVRVGDTILLTSTIVVGAGDPTVVWNRKLTVKERKESGETDYTDTLVGGKYTVNGMDNEIPAGEPTAITSDKHSKILAFKPANDDNPYLAASTFHLLALVETIVLPDKPVKAGDSWTTEVKNPAVNGKKMTITTTFVGADKADGNDVWKFKQSLAADTDGGKMTADGTATLDAMSGQIVKEDMDVKGVPVKIGPPTDWKIRVIRTEPAAK